MTDSPKAALLEKLRSYALREQFIPAALHEGLANYVCYGYRPGAFLQAVLSNDLLGAYLRADELNRIMLEAIVMFLHKHVPECCWGNERKFDDWLGVGGARQRVYMRWQASNESAGR